MWRFVLRENIRRLETLIARADSEAERRNLQQLLEEAKDELQELEQASTPAAVQQDTGLRYFAEHAVEEAVSAHAAQFSSLQIFDQSRERLIIAAQRNFRAPFLHYLSMMRPGDGSACGRCLETGLTAAIEDVNGDPAFEPHRAAALEAGFRAVGAFPVPSRSQTLIAVLSIYFSKPKHFTLAELEGLGGYAARLGADLEQHLPA
ncbi:MAG TPA: GAF domain-containing protein [Sphingomicrobium sp.]